MKRGFQPNAAHALHATQVLAHVALHAMRLLRLAGNRA